MIAKKNISMLILLLGIVAIAGGILAKKVEGFTCVCPAPVCIGTCSWPCTCLPVATSLSPSAGGTGNYYLPDSCTDCGTCVLWILPCFSNCGPGLAAYDPITCS